jgi:hypothetical protein
MRVELRASLTHAREVFYHSSYFGSPSALFWNDLSGN